MGKRAFRENSRRSLAERIAETLESEIINGQRKPRERLVELQFAKAFGVSRVTMRETLRILEREGLVTNSGKGFHVTDISPKEVEDIFQVLACLEEECTRRASPHLTEEELDKMAEILSEMEAAAEKKVISDYFDLNIRFHEVIQNACQNRKLVELMASLGKSTLRYRHLAMSLPGRLGQSVPEHQEILAALRRDDGHVAGIAARKSAEQAYEMLSAVLKANPRLL